MSKSSTKFETSVDRAKWLLDNTITEHSKTDVLNSLDYCLRKLGEGIKKEDLFDKFVPGVTFGELISLILLSKYTIENNYDKKEA